MEAFFLPLSQEPIEIYDGPTGSVIGELIPDEESGWELLLMKQQSGFFKVVVLYGKYQNDTLWLNSRDVGVVVQNYDSIPIFTYHNEMSNIVSDTLYNSLIANVLNYNQNMALIRYQRDNRLNVGWISRTYLCGNPMTTCN